MFDELRRVRDVVTRAVGALDVDCMDGATQRVLFDLLEDIKRPIAAAQALVVGGMERTGAWEDGKAKSPQAWVADRTGGSWGDACATVELGQGLLACPDTATALLDGRISTTQAGLVARAASVDPHAEYRMLDLAGRASVKELKDAAQRVVAAASGQTDEEQAAVHRTRFLRTWTGTDGAFHLQGRMTKADGAKVLAVLEPLMEIEFTNARRQGRRESPDAYRADALVALASRGSLGSGRRGGTPAARGSDEGTEPITADAVDAPPTAHVIVRVDHAALLRGHVEGDETCEIDGLGPVPLSDVERLMADPILTVLRTKGTEVLAASTSTRVIRRSLRQAIEQRDRVCVVPGCGIASGLEIDHLVPFAKGGPTSIENLQRLCKHHHRLKTTGRATLTRWETQDGPRFGWLSRTDEAEGDPATASGGGTRSRSGTSETGTDRPREPERFAELFPDTGTG